MALSRFTHSIHEICGQLTKQSHYQASITLFSSMCEPGNDSLLHVETRIPRRSFNPANVATALAELESKHRIAGRDLPDAFKNDARKKRIVPGIQQERVHPNSIEKSDGT